MSYSIIVFYHNSIHLCNPKRKDRGRILNIKYSAGNRGWHDKGQGKKVKGERIKVKGRWTMDDGRGKMDDGRWTTDDGGQKIISSEAEKVRATRAKKD